MPKHLAAQMTRAVTFAALCLALLVPAAPSYAGCPVCAIIKTTPAGRAVPDDNDLSIFDQLSILDMLEADPIAPGFFQPNSVAFLMSDQYIVDTKAHLMALHMTLADVMGAIPFASWSAAKALLPGIDIGSVPFDTLFVVGTSFPAGDRSLLFSALADFGGTGVPGAGGPSTQLVMNQTLFTQGLRDSAWDSSDFVVTVSIPEPASLALLGLGLVGIAVGRRRRG